MSWLLLTLANRFERRAEWLEWAESGLDFLGRAMDSTTMGACSFM